VELVSAINVKSLAKRYGGQLRNKKVFSPGIPRLGAALIARYSGLFIFSGYGGPARCRNEADK
jgi:hypothetical protein